MIKTHKLLQNKLYCYAPFNSIYVQADNGLAPCCHMLTQNKFKLTKEDTKINLFEHPFLEKIREQILNKEIPDVCRGCGKEVREHDVDKLDDPRLYSKGYVITYNINSFNQCNLQCKMCSYFCSTGLESINNNKIDDNTKEINGKIVEGFVEYILQNHRKNYFHVTLCGGEPLIDTTLETFFDLVPGLIKYKLAIQTNLAANSTIAKKRLDFMLMNKCTINTSIDGTPILHDYIRNSNWDIIQNNIDFIHSYNRTIYSANIVVQPLNIEYLPETIEYINSFTIPKILSATNPIHSPRILPRPLLKKCVEKLNSFNFNNTQYNSIRKVLNKELEYSQDTANWLKFCKYINHFDKIQNKSIFDIYPDWKKYWLL